MSPRPDDTLAALHPAVKDVTAAQGLFTIRSLLDTVLGQLQGVQLLVESDAEKDLLRSMRENVVNLRGAAESLHNAALGRVFERMRDAANTDRLRAGDDATGDGGPAVRGDAQGGHTG